ncbi:MAG: hypothetical protein ACKVTZ_11005 [Bacteroidia bacterium]
MDFDQYLYFSAEHYTFGLKNALFLGAMSSGIAFILRLVCIFAHQKYGTAYFHHVGKGFWLPILFPMIALLRFILPLNYSVVNEIEPIVRFFYLVSLIFPFIIAFHLAELEKEKLKKKIDDIGED